MSSKKTLLHLLAGLFVTTSCSVLGNTADQAEVDLEALKGRAAQVELSLGDLPEQFVEYVPEDGRMLGENDLFDVQNEFAFKSERENPQTILGMTTIYPYTQREISGGVDHIRSQMELITRSITKGYIFDRNVNVEELLLLNPVGDAYSGRAFTESLADIGYPEYHTRTQILVFERDRISVILLVQYVEEFPRPVSVEDVAHFLDQKIMELEAVELESEF
jgi:hypothetical protein